MFTEALLKIAKIWKQPKCPSVDECIKKLWYTVSPLIHKFCIHKFNQTQIKNI